MQFLLGSDVRQAHAAGTYAIYFEIARDELDGLSCVDALERVLREIDGDGVLYDALAIWWLHQGILERRLTLHHAGWAAERFQEAWRPERRHGAIPALRRLAE